jgi:hypothetical protein
VGTSYCYDGHENSPFGKIKPLFSRGGNSIDDGKPCNDGTQIEKFRQLLLEFQVFSNTNDLFEKPLKLARVEHIEIIKEIWNVNYFQK